MDILPNCDLISSIDTDICLDSLVNPDRYSASLTDNKSINTINTINTTNTTDIIDIDDVYSKTNTPKSTILECNISEYNYLKKCNSTQNKNNSKKKNNSSKKNTSKKKKNNSSKKKNNSSRKKSNSKKSKYLYEDKKYILAYKGTYLYAKNRGITTDELVELFKKIKKTRDINYIDLSDNNIDDDNDIIKVIEQLFTKKFPNLEYIILSGNKLGNNFIMGLIELLKKYQKKLFFDISNNKITSADQKLILEAWPNSCIVL